MRRCPDLLAVRPCRARRVVDHRGRNRDRRGAHGEGFTGARGRVVVAVSAVAGLERMAATGQCSGGIGVRYGASGIESHRLRGSGRPAAAPVVEEAVDHGSAGGEAGLLTGHRGAVVRRCPGRRGAVPRQAGAVIDHGRVHRRRSGDHGERLARAGRPTVVGVPAVDSLERVAARCQRPSAVLMLQLVIDAISLKLMSA